MFVAGPTDDYAPGPKRVGRDRWRSRRHDVLLVNASNVVVRNAEVNWRLWRPRTSGDCPERRMVDCPRFERRSMAEQNEQKSRRVAPKEPAPARRPWETPRVILSEAQHTAKPFNTADINFGLGPYGPS